MCIVFYPGHCSVLGFFVPGKGLHVSVFHLNRLLLLPVTPGSTAYLHSCDGDYIRTNVETFMVILQMNESALIFTALLNTLIITHTRIYFVYNIVFILSVPLSALYRKFLLLCLFWRSGKLASPALLSHQRAQRSWNGLLSLFSR